MDFKLVWLCRHGEAEHNVAGNFSIPDPPLTEKGQHQASSLFPILNELASIPEISTLINSVVPDYPNSPPFQLVLMSPMRRTIQTACFTFGDILAFHSSPKSGKLLDAEMSQPASTKSQPISDKTEYATPPQSTSGDLSPQIESITPPELPPRREKPQIPTYLIPDLQEISNFPCDKGSPLSILMSHFPFLSSCPRDILPPETWHIGGNKHREALPYYIAERVVRIKKLIWEADAKSVFIVSHGAFMLAMSGGAWSMLATLTGLGGFIGLDEKWKNTEVRLFKLYEDGRMERVLLELVKGRDYPLGKEPPKKMSSRALKKKSDPN